MNDLIITENYLKQNSIVNENCDMKTITPTLILVQDKYIEPLLGTKLFNEILAQINSQNVSADNQTLLNNHVLKVMIWYTLCEMTPVLKYRYMNKGVLSKNSENSSAADLQEVQFLMDKWRIHAEEYAERCTKFLVQNIVTYPLFIMNNNLDEISPNGTNYSTGFYLEGPDDYCCLNKYR